VATQNGTTRRLGLRQIILDPRHQCRASISDEAVDRYAEKASAGGKWDGKPPRVYQDDEKGKYWLADGWHRYKAHQKAGMKEMECEVVKGSFDDALLYAVGANATHAPLPRTNADKRLAVEVYLNYRHEKGENVAEISGREIGRACNVNNETADKVRDAWLAKNGLNESETRVGPDGKRQPVARNRSVPTSAVEDDTPAFVNEPVGTDAAPAGGAEVLDEKGRPIPEALLEDFDRLKEFQSDINALGQMAAKWTKHRHYKARGCQFLSAQSVQIAAQNLQAALSSSRPYIVCPSCHGTKVEGGLACGPACHTCEAEGEPQGWLPGGAWKKIGPTLQAVAEGFKKGDAYEGERDE
jgi:hypothetical protein